jgi:RNA recognition motif-containing protein
MSDEPGQKWVLLLFACKGLQYLRGVKREINMNIHVGNLAAEVTEDELKQEFTAFGKVTSVSIIKDKYSGQSRGFGFIEMPLITEGQAAISGLKGKVLKDQTLEVSEARPRSERGSYRDQRSGSYQGRSSSFGGKQ